MSITDEVAAERERHARRQARLRDKARREQQRLDARVLAIIRAERAEAAAHYEARARQLIAEETAARAAHARAAWARRHAPASEPGSAS